jgi:UDP-2,4-diacetamido-2,4,6-trideoxy-beta-L-altropyranose hydrolase
MCIMQVVFRVDASHEVGAGHVMRCLTLADALRANGAICRFVCREHPGNLIALVQARGYEVVTLPAAAIMLGDDAQPYASWLGSTWQDDAAQTLVAMRDCANLQWLVVDHYALDERWENVVGGACQRLLVIDDLANRRHNADIVLDQTFGRQPEDYRGLTHQRCELRCGVANVLLRPEFDEWRAGSLARRTSATLKRILISLGGVDKDNISRQILLALDQCELSTDVEVCVILGESSPWVADMRQLLGTLKYKIELRVAVNNMAELLAGCDLAIGAAGSSAWERCCLGVPTIMMVLADNQQEIAARLSSTGAAQLLMPGPDLEEGLVDAIQSIMADPTGLKRMSARAAELVPCSGAAMLARYMTGASV